MDRTHTPRRAWIALVPVLAALGMLGLMPTTSGAAVYRVPGYVPVTVEHTGWVWLSDQTICGSAPPCTPRPNAEGWRWNGSRWVAASVAPGWIYVYPYTNAWRWAWTERSGWVAISARIRLN